MSLATSNTGSCSEADQKEVDSTTVKALETQTFSEQVIHQLPRKTTQVRHYFQDMVKVGWQTNA